MLLQVIVADVVVVVVANAVVMVLVGSKDDCGAAGVEILLLEAQG